MKLLLLIATLLVSFIKPCFGDYRFEVLLESYSNPSHKLYDGYCCQFSHHFVCRGIVCNNMFIFCVRPYGYLAKTSLDRRCPDTGQTYVTSVIADDSISFSKIRTLNSVTNTTNPLTFYGQTWPGQVQLYTQVYDWNVFGNDFVDDIVQIWSLSVGTGTYSPSQTFQSQSGHITLTARARVTCVDKYRGPYCSVYCGLQGCGTNGSVVSPSAHNINKTDNEQLDMNITATLGEGDGNFSGIVQPYGKAVDGTTGNASSRQVSAIVGGVVGGVLCLILLTAVVLVCVWCLSRRSAEHEILKGTHEQDKYKATVESSGHRFASSSCGTYRRVNNKLYSQIPSAEDREEGLSESSSVTDFTVSEAATAPTLSNDSSAVNNPLYYTSAGRVTSQYSVIERRGSDVSTSHSDEESDGGAIGGEEEEGKSSSIVAEPIESGYSLVTRENMDTVDEASDSEESHTYSDAEPAIDKQESTEHKLSDLDASHCVREEHVHRTTSQYENISFS